MPILLASGRDTLMKLLRHLLFLLALAPGLAMAQPADPFADLTGSGFDDIRRGIEALLGTPVYLDLRVKVAKDWQRDPRQLRRLGF